MTQMLPALPALGALLAYLIFVSGYRMLRSDVVEGLDAGDLRLLSAERQREARNELSLIERLGRPLVRPLRRALPTPAIAWLERLVHHSGRPAGVSVDSLLRRMGGLVVALIPVGIVLIAAGMWYLLPVLALAGLSMPLSKLAATANRRREQIDGDLPDFLDILAVTVTAGIAFRPALRRVAARFQGALSDDINLALDRLTHGASVREAFEQMRDRSRSKMMARFVRAFLQAEELGAPLAETLNQIALDMRRDNAQRLRQKAGQAAPRVSLVGSVILVPAAILLIILAFVFSMDLNIDLDNLQL